MQISGDFTRIYLNGSYKGTDEDRINAAKMRSIDQWGTPNWITMDSAFEGATNMVYRATDIPDLSGVTNMSDMFTYAESFNGDISCLLYTSPSPRDRTRSRMPSSA